MEKVTIKDIIAALVLFLIFAIVGVLIFVEIPTNNKDILYPIAGGLLPTATIILGYYFGSSFNSSKKDDTITTLSNNQK
jgi:uncharacterized RDD family membrane protein YckC